MSSHTNPAAAAEFVGFTHAKSAMSSTDSVTITVNSSLELAVPPGDVIHSRTRGNGEGNV